MGPNSLETADLVTFTQEIFKGKLHFVYSVHHVLNFMYLVKVRLDVEITCEIYLTNTNYSYRKNTKSIVPRIHHTIARLATYLRKQGVTILLAIRSFMLMICLHCLAILQVGFC